MSGQARRPTLRTPAALAEAGLLAADQVPALDAVAERYAIAVPPHLADLIGSPDDPIGRQVLPRLEELDARPEERADPIGDAAHSPLPGLVHRYPDRVLLTLLHVCPVYCRFCFRRERVGPGAEAVLPEADVERALDYIAERPAIWEVIFTGGDPLGLPPRRLAAVVERLAGMPHVRILRFHTRVPVAVPEWVTAELAEALLATGKTTYVGVHCNHPQELTPAAEAACARLAEAGIALVSQTVLLRGVNDDAETLAALMRRLVELRIRPYYLHHGDLAPGTAHFRLGLAEGRALVAALRGRISGLCQPTYVLDIPGGYGKVPVGPAYVEGNRIIDPWGGSHAYPGGDQADPPVSA